MCGIIFFPLPKLIRLPLDRRDRVTAKIMMMRFHQKPILVAAAFLILAALFLSFLHHHADGQDFDNCVVCKFVRQIVLLGLAFAVFLLFSPAQDFPFLREDRFLSLFLTSKLRTRAPPLLS